MNIKITKIAKTAWGMFGKKALGKAACSSAVEFVEDLCQQYNVSDDSTQNLKRETGNLFSYMVDCMLNGDEIESSYIDQQINGPIADAILKAAYSSNDGENFLSEILNRLDDSTISDVERFLLQVGSKTGCDYVASLHKMLQSIHERVKEDNYAGREGYIDKDINSQSEVSSLPIKTSDKTAVASSEQRGVLVHDGMSEKEDKEFVDNLTTDIGKALADVKLSGKMGPAQMTEMTKLFINKSAEVAKFCEVQKTKRVQIRAQTSVAIHQIDAIRDVLKDYLERSFDERRKIFEKEFAVVDKCLTNGDTQALAVTLNSITSLAQSSPFKALSDLGAVRKTLENKGTFDI